MSRMDIEVLDASGKLLQGEIELDQYLMLLEEKLLINKLDVQVVYMLSWKTGEPMMKTEVARLVGSDLKYVRRCITRVIRVLTNYDDKFEKIALDCIGVPEGRLEWPSEQDQSSDDQ